MPAFATGAVENTENLSIYAVCRTFQVRISCSNRHMEKLVSLERRDLIW